MPTVESLSQQIGELDQVQREELLMVVSEEMRTPRCPEFPSIVATPDVRGGAPRLIRTRIPVWTIERMRQLGTSEIDILRSYPRLRAIDLVQAWSYAASHRDEIEREIRENEEA